MDAESGTSQATRSQKRLDKYVKAMGFLKQPVIGRWKAAVQQEKQQREEREKAEAAERATAAAAAEAQRALHAKVQELTRERGALRDEMYARRVSREIARSIACVPSTDTRRRSTQTLPSTRTRTEVSRAGERLS